MFARRDNRSDVSKTEMGVVTPQDPFSLACVSGQSDVGSDVTLDPRLSCHQIGGRTNDQEIVIHVSNNAEDKGLLDLIPLSLSLLGTFFPAQ